MNSKIIVSLLLVTFANGLAFADSPETILKQYEESERAADAKFGGFSATQGKKLYLRKEQSSKGEVACATCHTADPKAIGRTRANKNIEPLAPAANSKRFTDYKHVEKWFTRNCDDVLRRPCTTQEKGDFIAYLLSIK